MGIKLGYAPTRRSIFSAPDAVKYRNLTADKLREMGVDFVDIDDINDEGLLYDENDRLKIVEKFRREKVDGLLTDEMAQSLDSLPPLEAIDALIRRYVAFIRDLGPMLGEYYRVLLEHPNRVFRDGTQRFGREFRALLERAISEGDLVTDQGAEALTEVGLRLLRGTFMDWLIRGCSFDLEAAYTRGFAAFLRYARG